MDNLAQCVTKAIADLLEQSEKRFVAQQVTQETQAKLVDSLLAKIEGLETQCRQLTEENARIAILETKCHQLSEEIARIGVLEVKIQQFAPEISKIQNLETKCLQLTSESAKIEPLQTKCQELSEGIAKIEGIENRCQQLSQEIVKIHDLESKSTVLTAETSKIEPLTNRCEHLEAKVTKIGELETTCQRLTDVNLTLSKELEYVKQHENNVSKELAKANTELSRLQKCVGEFDRRELIDDLAISVDRLIEFRNMVEVKVMEIFENQQDIAKEIRRQKKQAAAAALAASKRPVSIRGPTRSPSTSSYLNGNTHSSLPPQISRIPNSMRNLFSHDTSLPLDVDEEMCELSDHAENLKRGVEALNDLQRSFEKNSIYSDD